MHCVQYGIVTAVFFLVSFLYTWISLPGTRLMRHVEIRQPAGGFERVMATRVHGYEDKTDFRRSFEINRQSVLQAPSRVWQNEPEEVTADAAQQQLMCSGAKGAPVPRGVGVEGYSPDWVQTQDHLCQITEDVPEGLFLLIQVHSHPAHKERRDAIRATWGAVARRFSDRLHVGLVFLLGLPSSGDLKISHEMDQSVRREGKLYRDIVQGRFADTYRNLTIKSIMGLRWTNTFCCNARYILKTDDDVYFNVSLLVAYLRGLPRRGVLVGSIYSDSQVMREGQWQVKRADFPASVFPPYCAGAAYVMSPDVSLSLHVTFVTQTPKPLLTIEDAYVTGFLANSANLSCAHSDLFPNWMSTPSIKTLRRFFHHKVIAIHGVPYAAMYQIEKLIKLCTDCGSNMSNLEDWFLWIGRNSTFGT